MVVNREQRGTGRTGKWAGKVDIGEWKVLFQSEKSSTFVVVKRNIMNIIETPIEGLLIIEPDVFKDERGFFMETYNAERYAKAGIKQHFVQSNMSSSSYGVVRGLHFQRAPYSQSKLVSCIVGMVFDVAVDLREGSKTFGDWFSVVLTEENHRQFLIPQGFAHGFSVLSEQAVFAYQCDNFYHKESEGGILLTDPQLNIDWQVPKEKMIVSEKDKQHPLLEEYIQSLKH